MSTADSTTGCEGHRNFCGHCPGTYQLSFSATPWNDLQLGKPDTERSRALTKPGLSPDPNTGNRTTVEVTQIGVFVALIHCSSAQHPSWPMHKVGAKVPVRSCLDIIDLGSGDYFCFERNWECVG